MESDMAINGSMRIYAVQTPAARLKRMVSVVIVVAAVAILGPQAFASDSDAGPGSSDVASVDFHTVVSGETLWSIAQSVTPQDGDVRDTVSQIQTLNAMSDSSLQVGAQILVPLHG
jgi:Tfp pilus assembly protein FimV